MPQSTLHKAKGLHTFKNDLEGVPDGGLDEALNVIIDRDGIIEPRRGITQYTGTAFAEPTKQLLQYKRRILAHHGTTLSFEADPNGTPGVFNDFAGVYNEIAEGRRLRGIEANGNFYFTTVDGIKKISAATAAEFTTASGFITDAGGPKALDIEANIDYSNFGFLPPYSKVAYRVVWGITDANDNLILGAPSSRVVVENRDASNSARVNLTIPIPDEITNTAFFYQVYRTGIDTQATLNDLANGDPGDEHRLIFEEFVSLTDLAPPNGTGTGIIITEDITPDDIRNGGPNLYTNLVSGEGTGQANETPPFAKDIELYKGYTFYANTSTRHQGFLSFLSISQLVDGDQIFVTDGATTSAYTFRGNNETYTVDFSSMTFPGGKASLDGKYFLLVSGYEKLTYKVWYDNTGTTTEPSVSGTIGIKIDIQAIADTAVDIAAKTLSDIELQAIDFNITDDLAGTLTIANANNGEVANGIGRQIVSSPTLVDEILNEITLANHGFNTNDQITYNSDTTDIGGLTSNSQYYVIKVDDNTFQVESTIGGGAIVLTDDGVGTHTFSAQNIGANFSILQDGLGDGEDTSAQEIFLPRQRVTLPNGFVENGPTVSQQLDQVARSMIRVINSDTSSTIRAFYISTDTDLPGQMFFDQANLTGPAFNIYAEDGGVGTETRIASQFTPTLGVQGINESEFQSTNEVRPNRIYYSKFQQPEAVPLLNFIDIGPKDQVIERIVALRDSLFIFKEDGIYRLSGEIAPFSIAPFDFSLTLQAPDTAVVLNNQVHCFTTQGVAQVTDTGVNVISRNIEDRLLNITREGFKFAAASFGVSYETDRSYMLWTVSEPTDTVATQCFRYNAFTSTWTRWDLTKTCGLVNQRDNKLYLGASDINIIEQERKGLDRTDYADRQFDNVVTTNNVNGDLVGVGTTVRMEVGDALLQTQYLTLSQYNRLLNRLDADTGVTDTDYFSLFESVPGTTMRARVTALAQKLDADTGVTDTDYESSLGLGLTFPDIQTDFNIIVNKLNLDATVAFDDYDLSVGTVPIEAVITEIVDTNVSANTVRTNFPFPFISGLVVHYKAIQTSTVYSPQAMGDVSLFKQFSEGTFIFENNNFTTATVGYKSDLSPGFEDITFSGNGVGDWGQFQWNNQNWGGFSSAKPFRTYIPRQKQRGRFLNPRLQHRVAFEKYSLLGISLTFRPYSTKAYK